MFLPSGSIWGVTQASTPILAPDHPLRDTADTQRSKSSQGFRAEQKDILSTALITALTSLAEATSGAT
jgi:hypothetical protein